MNLQDLKEMIKEEFEAYNEQEDPMVSVSDAEALQERFKKLANIIKG